MGCGGSKEGKTQDRKIDAEFADVNIQRYDSFFNDVRALLQTAEGIRSGVEDSREQGAELAGTWQLKDPKYSDIVQVLFWAASAENEGNISKTDLEVTKEAPFVKINGSKIHEETYKLYETLETYLKTVTNGPERVKEIVDKLQVMADKAPGLVTEGKTEIQNSTLGMTEKAKAVANLAKNGNKLPRELAKCKNLQETLNQAKTDMLDLVPKLLELSSKADEVGAKAFGDKVIRPSEIFEKYHPGAKKTPKEIEDERKAKESKK